MRRGRAAICTVVLATAGVAAPVASAARPDATGLPQTASSEHFLVHYTTAPGPDTSDTPSVDRLLAAAERAYGIEVGRFGFPAPRSDGDGKIDVYVMALDIPGILGLTGRGRWPRST